MTLSENLVRHLYVLGSSKTSYTTTGENDAQVTTMTYEPVKLTDLPNLGDFAVALTADKESLFIQHKGKGGITRSDLIPVANILYAHATAPADMAKPLKKATIKLGTFDVDHNGTPDTVVPKGTYVVRITIRNYVGMSDEDFYFKYGLVISNGSLNYGDFYTKLAASLKKNLSREACKLFTVTYHTTDGVTITEEELPWRLGVMPRTLVDFTVELIPNELDFDVERSGATTTYDWGTVTTGTSGTLSNGKDIADMEYFLMGERADIYRSVGWPYTMETQYMVVPSLEYYTLDIHYAYTGANECVQKSEKTLTLVAAKPASGTDTGKAAIKVVIDALEDKAGVTVTKSASYN